MNRYTEYCIAVNLVMKRESNKSINAEVENLQDYKLYDLFVFSIAQQYHEYKDIYNFDLKDENSN